MCSTCGCSDDAGVRISSVAGTENAHEHPHTHTVGHTHDHPHEHPHGHTHAVPGAGAETLSFEQSLLAKNDLMAAHNRGWLEGRDIDALNVMSSPGAGKTTLLVRTIEQLRDRLEMAVIEGDQDTTFDADRIRATGSPVVQINTGAGCHLDADMLQRALAALSPAIGSTVFVENVGNLVCPALFDLGEAQKIVIVSVTEGDDKPEKYPHMFHTADLLIVNKADLLPYVDFDVDRFLERARLLNPRVEALVLSATTGEGLEGWFDWLTQHSRAATASFPAGRAGDHVPVPTAM